MGDLSKLKIAVGQIEFAEGRPSRNESACDSMVERALDCSADLLVVPNSLSDERDVRLIGLNDSRIDVSGQTVMLDICGESYRIGLGRDCPGCDFSIAMDLRPFTLAGSRERTVAPGTIVLRPVGIRDRGKRILCFDGGTRAVGADGRVQLRLRDDFDDDFAVFSFGDAPESARPTQGKLLAALASSIRRFDALCLPFAPKWVIGLSGGLDSSVTAALLVLALGPERVIGYNLATRFNTEGTKANAAQLAGALGIPLRNGSIEDMVVSVGNALVGYGYPYGTLSGLVLENVQARARGNLLSTFAAVEGGVVANNGNRVEGALGYATLYGDAIGALAPLGDLTKVQLFGLAREINAHFGREAVPENLLPVETDGGFTWETMPSAELAAGQRDPMKWFYHDWLISRLLGDGCPEGELSPSLDDAACEVMEAYLADRLASSPVAKWVAFYGLDDPRAFADDMQWVVESMRRAAFKRVQAPPAVALASPASVADRVDSQLSPEPANRYRALLYRIRSSR